MRTMQFSFPLSEMQYDKPQHLQIPWSLCLPWKIFVPFKTWLLLKKLITSWVLGKDTFKISTKSAVLSLKMWSNYWAKCLIDVLLISQIVTLNQQSCVKRASQRDNKSDCQQLLMIENLVNIIIRNISSKNDCDKKLIKLSNWCESRLKK